MHFEIFRENTSVLGAAREFYVRLVNDGRPLATTGDGYVSKDGAQYAIDLIVATGDATPVASGLPTLHDYYNYDARGLRFEIYTTLGGAGAVTLLAMQQFTHRWRLVSRNGKKILHGNIAYSDEAGCLREISLVKATTVFTRVENL